MKKTYFMHLMSIASLCLLIIGCKKEKDNVVPTTDNNNQKPTFSSVSEVFNQLKVKPKTVTINASTGASFYGNSGTRYIIPANALEKMDGTAVSGNVDITVSEYLKKGDMIFSKMLPVSNGQPLISGGELDIKATQDGATLRLKDNMIFTANIPQEGTADPAMIFFMGEQTHDDKQNNVNWQRPQGQGAQGKGNGVVVIAGDTLSLFSDSMMMCNADQFMTSPNYKTFTVDVTVTDASIVNEDDVYAYAVYDTYLGMWPMMQYAAGKINENHVPGIPVHFVVFALIDGEFYGGISSATPDNGQTYSVTLTKTDADSFKEQVNDL